ncbi:MAG: hypothetical protein ACFCVK_17670 [Acidimicrobiales bacterium]
MRPTPSALAEGLRRRWWRWVDPWPGRLRRWAVPEVVIGSVIAVGWAVAATWTLGPLVVAAVAVITVILQLTAVETGGHGLVWFLTGWLLALVLGTSFAHDGFPPLGYTAAALTVVAHTESIRLTHSRRRSAHRDGGIMARTVVGWWAVAMLSAATVAAITPLADAGVGRAWWWLPVAAGAVLVVVVALSVGPTVRAPAPQRQRWRPGERLEPRRPEAATDVDPVGPTRRGR